ncbi:MAG TPA: tail fiber protein [Candidatus Dormibacteraeota bacterium]|jgi:microcystin-dependent protein|nr:tail fiber protein [Candidatus Dormibacteraeota bacterium]
MGTPFLGEIRMVGFNFAPVGWEQCQGQLLPISQYDALFNLIGTTYGGDGQSDFALPALQSRIPVHMGQGNGLSNRVIGQMAGEEEVLLSLTQLPAHTHVAAANRAGSTPAPTANVWAGWTGTQYSSAAPDSQMAAAVGLAPPDPAVAHDNMLPFLVLNFIIATEGIYPPR